jgi:hypothetical protein
MYSVCFKDFLVIVIAGNTDLIWRESTVVQFTDVLFNGYLSSTKGDARERWKARGICCQQKQESRREFDDVCGSCHAFAFLYIFPVSFHHPFIYFSVYSRYSQMTKIWMNLHNSPRFWEQVFLGTLTRLCRGADMSLARPTSRCILFDGENITFDASLVIYIYI